MYSTLEIILQILSSLVIGASTFLRSWTKDHMYLSSWCSLVGGILFTIYSIMTHQWGLVPLNLYTAFMGLRAIYVWRDNEE